MEMLEELKGASEIAIDLEHHDTRSYVGLVSLMQISIRSKDWIVDTLKPWRHRLQVLNEVFADPKIVKVGFSVCFRPISKAYYPRCSMARLWIWSGFNAILDSTSLGYSILTGHAGL